MGNFNKELGSYTLAIKTEEEGYRFYKDAAEKSSDKIQKETFKSFADDELKHKEMIDAFYSSFEKGEAGDNDNLFGVCNTLEAVKTIFANAGENVDSICAGGNDDVIAPYRLASSLEGEAIDFYKDLSSKVINGREKELFEYLMRMEEAHKEILDNMIEYLINPGDWFFNQERWSIGG